MRQVSSGARWGAAVLASVVLLAGASGAHAAFTPEACLAKKLKEWGKLRYCEAKENGKTLQARSADLAKCQMKFAAKITRLTEQATAATIACRYGDNGDGTVTDYDTGLMWERKTDDGTVHDKDHLGTWSTGPVTSPNGTAFTDHLGTLNNGTSSNGVATSGCFAGQCDWRLPAIEELAGIADCTESSGSTDPCIDQAVFGPTINGFYWSATTKGSDSTRAFGYNFPPTVGGIGDGPKSEATAEVPGYSYNYLRAVRSAFPELPPVAVAPGNGACLAKKLKEWGKRRYCEAKENGKALQGRPFDLAKCQTKFAAKLAAISAQAAANACRYGDNDNGTVTDYDTGLQWEQKKDICPAGYTASGTYTAPPPYNGGDFTLAVNEAGTEWSGTAQSGIGPIPCSGSVTGATFSGTCVGGLPVSGSFDCSALSVTIGYAWGNGSGSAVPGGADVQDVNARYTWSTGVPWLPTGTVFTVFLGTLNNGTSSNGSVTSGCFAEQCDWRLPLIEELAGILDPTQGDCGGGSGPCIDQTVFGPAADYYWSATTDASPSSGRAASGVRFLTGGVAAGLYKDINTIHVRGVRSGL